MMRRPWIYVLATLALTSGCKQAPPSGQVIARVNGEEITKRDLVIEMRANGMTAGTDLQSVQAAVLDQIIARKLLAAKAKAEKLDRTPEYLADFRRMREIILADQLVKQGADQDGEPTQAQLIDYMAKNPQAFADRQNLVIDRIQTALDSRSVLSEGDSQDLEDIVARLKRAERPFHRAQVSIDSLTLAPADAKAFSVLPQGKSRIYSQAGVIVADSVLARNAIALTPEANLALAKGLLASQKRADRANQAAMSLRSEAKIEYQSSFRPKL
jgi:EpsD family peptidyl-prolyl cis-trans isomerase